MSTSSKEEFSFIETEAPTNWSNYAKLHILISSDESKEPFSENRAIYH